MILFWGDRGIDARTADLGPVARLTSRPSRYPFVNSARTELYYLAPKDRQVRHLNLRTGIDRIVAQLPALRNRCFQARSPVENIRMASDVRWDETHRELCFDIGDRNENMVSVTMNFSVALGTGRVRSAYTLALDGCKEQGVVESKPVCAVLKQGMPLVLRGLPVGAAASRGKDKRAREEWPFLSRSALTKLGLSNGQLIDPSPSRRWFRFHDFEEQGDYIYTAILFFDALKGKIYGINHDPGKGIPDTKRPLRPLAYAKLRGQMKPPPGLCLIPAESSPSWIPWRDTFLLDACVSGIGVLTPPGPMQVVPADGFIFF